MLALQKQKIQNKNNKKKTGTFKATRTQEIDYALLSEKVGGPEKGLLWGIG